MHCSIGLEISAYKTIKNSSAYLCDLNSCCDCAASEKKAMLVVVSDCLDSQAEMAASIVVPYIPVESTVGQYT